MTPGDKEMVSDATCLGYCDPPCRLAVVLITMKVWFSKEHYWLFIGRFSTKYNI